MQHFGLTCEKGINIIFTPLPVAQFRLSMQTCQSVVAPSLSLHCIALTYSVHWFWRIYLKNSLVVGYTWNNFLWPIVIFLRAAQHIFASQDSNSRHNFLWIPCLWIVTKFWESLAVWAAERLPGRYSGVCMAWSHLLDPKCYLMRVLYDLSLLFLAHFICISSFYYLSNKPAVQDW
jgi:hypothetical protein